MIRNVIFDIGKVLIGFDWDRYMDTMFDMPTADKVTAAMFGSDHWKELDRAVLPVDEILELFIKEGPDVEAQIRQAFEQIGNCVTRRDWAIQLLESIRDRGYKLYYLSNMSEHVKNSDPEAFDFVSHMDGGVWSCDVHLIKPDPAIYFSLMDKYDLVPEECLFIDDHVENVAAARRLGMKAIRFDSLEQLGSDLNQALTKDSSHDKITVVCYGDSNTYGYDPSTGGRYPREKRWTTILEDKLGVRYEVIPEGLNGRTTAHDRPNAAWKNGVSSFIACLGTHKPVDILTIMLGTNDCIAGLGLHADQIASGMETLVSLAYDKFPELQGYVPRIIVIAPAAIGEGYEKSPLAYELNASSFSKSREIGPLFAKIAQKYTCDFIDAVDAVEVSDLDCMHLSETGHRQLAELIYNTII